MIRIDIANILDTKYSREKINIDHFTVEIKIFSMEFKEIIKSDVLNLNHFQSDNESFREYFKRRLNEYLLLIKELDNSPLHIPKINSSLNGIISKQTEFINGLKETLESYLDGHPSDAFERLKNTLSNRMTKYKNLFKISKFEISEDFYRIRKLRDNNSYKPEEFFHIPFHLREKVTTQRFSIPGFPSLYLGKTVYVCWEELGKPNINNFHAIRLKSTKPITYIDLAPPFLDSDLNQAKYYRYLMTWPLIFACTIRVKKPHEIFKPEYIIPQLLLQWIRLNKEIDGIRYWSTHVKESPSNFKGQHYNIVLPVKANKDTGLCEHLCNLFELTEIVSWQSREFALGASHIEYSREFSDPINAKMEYLELINGLKYPYSYSVFGEIENSLSFLETRKINSY